MDADTARALLRDGLPLLEGLPPYDEGTALHLGTRLREEGHDPALVAAVLSQSRLRARARSKFGDHASSMLFTADGLEQATRWEVADAHAARFAAAGVSLVHDLGCGLGADSLALTRAGLTASAVDADEATALLADHNLTSLAPPPSMSRTSVTDATAPAPSPDSASAQPGGRRRCRDGDGDDGRPDVRSTVRSRARWGRAEDVTPGAGDGVWFDPARRTPGRTDAAGRTRRTFRLEDLTPSWEVVTGTAQRVPATGAKLSPAFPHAQIPAGAEAEWVSTGGDLVECALWWGPLVRTPGRTATLRRQEGGALTVTESDAAGAPPPGATPEPGDWFHEPDLAVLQAGLVGALARAVDGVELSAGVGYVVAQGAQAARDVPYARRRRVAEVLPAGVKPVKTWLRRQGITGATVKRRGGRLDPAEFRRRVGLSERGGDQATLVLTQGAEGPLVLVLDS